MKKILFLLALLVSVQVSFGQYYSAKHFRSFSSNDVTHGKGIVELGNFAYIYGKFLPYITPNTFSPTQPSISYIIKVDKATGAVQASYNSFLLKRKILPLRQRQTVT